MIEVTQEDDNTFTISWDENDPIESVFNTWTEEDFINAIQDKLKALEELGVLDNATEAVNQINDHIEDTTLYEFIDQTAEELFEDISNAEKFTDWYSVKEEAIREYQDTELKEDRTVPPPPNFPLFP